MPPKRKTLPAPAAVPSRAFCDSCAADGISAPSPDAQWMKLRHLTGPDYSTAAAKMEAAAAWSWALSSSSLWTTVPGWTVVQEPFPFLYNVYNLKNIIMSRMTRISPFESLKSTPMHANAGSILRSFDEF